MKTRRITVNFYDTKEERDTEIMKAIEHGLSILYEIKECAEYGFAYETDYKKR